MNTFNLINHVKGEDDTTVIWLYNIGVERYWSGVDDFIKDPKEDNVVNHMEEMNLLLTKKQDYLILRRKPEKAFLDELEKLSFEIPHILYPAVEDENKWISELVLEDEVLLNQLKEIAKNTPNTYFVPYGVSHMEEKIADICKLNLIGSTSEQYKIVNNKIYAKDIAKSLEYPVAPGYICKTFDEIKEAYHKLRETYDKIIIKMPNNASGKGMWIVEDEKRLKVVCLIIQRYAKNNVDVNWMVEGWIDKKCDLNIQVNIAPDGEVTTYSVSQQLLDGIVYCGSIISNHLPENMAKISYQYGNDVGKLLCERGYKGNFGLDVLISKDDILYPIEINGRFNLSTYLSFLKYHFHDKYIFSTYKRIIVKEDITYSKFIALLKEKNLWVSDGKGILCYVASTMDSNLAQGNCRAFIIIITDDKQEIQGYLNGLNTVLANITME